MRQCQICTTQQPYRVIEAREMMMGLREAFQYHECLTCGAVQLTERPHDVARFYAGDYYSFNTVPQRNQASLLAQAASQFVKTYFKRLARTTRILDIGCGSGQLVYGLAELGIQKAVGLDPFIEEAKVFDNGSQIVKHDIHSFQESDWDIIMFNHSFEHVWEQRETLQRARNLIRSGGVILIRMPTVSSYAWHTYGRDWVALDAPRHTCLHSVESMQLLAEQAAVRIRGMLYDSSEFQFIGSEQYRKDIPLYGDGSYFVDPRQSLFTQEQIRTFQEQARRLNTTKQGDTAAWYLAA